MSKSVNPLVLLRQFHVQFPGLLSNMTIFVNVLARNLLH